MNINLDRFCLLIFMSVTFLNAMEPESSLQESLSEKEYRLLYERDLSELNHNIALLSLEKVRLGTAIERDRAFFESTNDETDSESDNDSENDEEVAIHNWLEPAYVRLEEIDQKLNVLNQQRNHMEKLYDPSLIYPTRDAPFMKIK